MRADPIELEVFKHLFHAVAEEMGAALRRTAFSPNIKERRDYSCALFDAAGNVLAMGDHMPVHLGSMPMSVRAAIAELPLAPGDVAMLNDPFRGGTHLPDITVVAPVFVRRATRNAAPEFFVAARAHHADVGGTYAGSMGPCREIYQEGLRIPPVKIVRAGTLDRDILALLLNNVRTPEEREGDLSAQLAACHTGSTRLLELCARYGIARVQRAARALLDYSEKMMRAFLATAPAGSYAAEDVLDDDGVTDEPVRIAVRITFPRATRIASRKPRSVIIDFTGSSPQVEGSINAVEAITYSACFYVFRCLLREDVPATAGLMRPIQLIAPEGTIVNARPPAAVAGGNVETSQRIVDVLLRALAQALPQHIPAASSGTMNNLTIGGMDDRHATRPDSREHTSKMVREGARRIVLEGPRRIALEGPRRIALEGAGLQPRRQSRHKTRALAPEGAGRTDLPSSVILSDESGRDSDQTRSRRTPIPPTTLPLTRSHIERSASAGVPHPSLPLARVGSGLTHKDEGPSSSVILSDESGRDSDQTRSRRTPILPTNLPLAHFSTESAAADGVEGPAALARAGRAIPFAYYETVAGGSGASAAHDGVSGVHTHMTNSLNTPAEALEYSYPLRVMKYALRAGSGGEGKHRGGDGIVREMEVLADATVTLLADRRKSRPYGLAGGEDGAPGRTEILRADGSTELMPSKGSTRLRRGERVRIETPGGGGWGKAEQDENSSA
jgi:N-methylhydantoinase B